MGKKRTSLGIQTKNYPLRYDFIIEDGIFLTPEFSFTIKITVHCIVSDCNILIFEMQALFAHGSMRTPPTKIELGTARSLSSLLALHCDYSISYAV